MFFLDFPWSSKVDEMRTGIFQINSFQPWQLETINLPLTDHDWILIMPTGGGKSLCYQLPAVISDGKINKTNFFFKYKNIQIFRYNNCFFHH